MQENSKKLVISLTGKSPIEINPNDWPIIAFTKEQQNPSAKPTRKLIIREKNDQYLVYGTFYPPTSKEKAIRAGELVFGSSTLPATIKAIGTAIGAPETLIQQTIQKLPAVKEGLVQQPDLAYLSNAAVVFMELRRHSQNQNIEHVNLRWVAGQGEAYQNRITQPLGQLQKALRIKGFHIEPCPDNRVIALRTTAILDAVINTDDEVLQVQVKTTAGVFSFVPFGSVEEVIARLSWGDCLSLVKQHACCAECVHMCGLVTEGSLESSVSYGTFMCNHTEEAGMISDDACQNFERDKSSGRAEKIKQWQEEGLLPTDQKLRLKQK